MKRCIVTIILTCLGLSTQAPTPTRLTYPQASACRDDGVSERRVRVLRIIMSIERPRSDEGAWKAYVREGAVGLLQIRPIMVREVNRVVGYPKYFLADRRDSTKSVEMFYVYQDYYNPTYDEKKACYLWCGGPSYQDCSYKGWIILRRYWEVYSIRMGLYYSKLCI